MMRRNKIVLAIFTTLLFLFIASVEIAIAATQHDYVVSLLKAAGLKDVVLGTEDDRDALAKSLGFFKNWEYDSTATLTEQVEKSMDIAMADAYKGLQSALNKKPMEPYFVNGMAQPIFYYGNSKYSDTSNEGVIRFIVYVETDLDTDGDGKLDLAKTLVQLPRAALDGGKFSTVYEARPYIEGTGSQRVPDSVKTAGDSYMQNNPSISHEELYKTATPRTRSGEATLADMVANAKPSDWYYLYSYSSDNASATVAPGTGENENNYEDLNWYDYFLVRGFAVVQSAGIGSAGSEGFSTCGSDVEINAFRCVIEWLTGDRKAYTDKTNNIEIKADWSNGNVGMTGRSYAGTTQFGLATSGVKGLKTIVPVAGIASWYEYTNGQGVAISNEYTTGLAWYVNSRLAAPNWAAFSGRYSGYSQLMRKEENVLLGDYGPHWARRDYTVDNWFRDWGPSKIQVPMLIVHGANDDNVRPKQAVLMYEAAKKAGVEVKWLWHQGHHMTPTFPAANPNAADTYRPYSMYCGDYTYDEWLNLWFSHHLYGVDNGIMKLMPGVLALDNASGKWVTYDAWESPKTIVLKSNSAAGGKSANSAQSASPKVKYEEPEDYSVDFPLLDHTDEKAVNRKRTNAAAFMPAASAPFSAAAGEFSVINSASSDSNWQNLIDAPTAGSTVYHLDLAENVTIKGVTKVNVRAAINSLGVSADEPLRMHVKLVEVAAPGTTLKFYGGNAVGASIGVTTIKAGGAWQGGGIKSQNLAEFNQTDTGTYREIAKGWIDLCNPSAVFDSRTADRKGRIIAKDNLNKYNDYAVYLQPAIHTATKGNKLALIITSGSNRAFPYTGDSAFSFTIDNKATSAIIPQAVPVIMLNAQLEPITNVTAGNISGSLTIIATGTMGIPLSYQWYSNTTNSNTDGTPISGETNASFVIPTMLNAGDYYYFCEVSAPGADSVRSNVGTVKVVGHSSNSGCSTSQFGLMALLMIGAIALLKKR